MTDVYVPKYFKAYEFFPKDFHAEAVSKYSEMLLWFLLDWRLSWTADRLREKFGSIIINDWHSGGQNQYRGYRPLVCNVGASLSQHKFYRAADLIFKSLSADDVRKTILADPWHEDFQHITCLEIDISWLHMDFRFWDKRKYGIKLVKP